MMLAQTPEALFWIAGVAVLAAVLLFFILRYGVAGWAMAVSVVAVLSVVVDAGGLVVLREARLLGVSPLSLLLLAVCLGMMVRILRLVRRGEREALAARVRELEREMAELHRPLVVAEPEEEGEAAEETRAAESAVEPPPPSAREEK